MNKKGGFTDMFLFIVIALIVIVSSALFIYIGGKVNAELQSSLGDRMFGDQNASEIISNTVGKTDQSFQALYWISIFLIVGMIMSIFIGSYLVTTRPVFFVPYMFISVIAVIVSIGISNAYEQIVLDPTLNSIFMNFVGANFIMSRLPIVVTIVSFVGGIIMFARMGSRENELYGGGYIG